MSMNSSQLELEMQRATEVIRNFNPLRAQQAARDILVSGVDRVYWIGEGSSIIFPAKYAGNMYKALTKNSGTHITLEARHAGTVDFGSIPDNSFVFLASNSGNTREIKRALPELRGRHLIYYGVTAYRESELGDFCGSRVYLLDHPPEKATPATKSAVEQAAFFNAVVHELAGREFPIVKGKPLAERLAGSMDINFTRKLPRTAISALESANTVYWVDKDLGVAEELAWKTTEITRKKAAYHQGTKMLHSPGEGIKENDLIVVVDAHSYSEEDIHSIAELASNTGAGVLTFENADGSIPSLENLVSREFGREFSYLALGWNYLRRAALNLGLTPGVTTIVQKFRE